LYSIDVINPKSGFGFKIICKMRYLIKLVLISLLLACQIQNEPAIELTKLDVDFHHYSNQAFSSEDEMPEPDGIGVLLKFNGISKEEPIDFDTIIEEYKILAVKGKDTLVLEIMDEVGVRIPKNSNNLTVGVPFRSQGTFFDMFTQRETNFDALATSFVNNLELTVVTGDGQFLPVENKNMLGV